MDYALCVLRSMSIFDKLKMDESPSGKVALLSVLRELLAKDDYFLLLYFCFFCTVATSGMMSISKFVFSARMQCDYFLITSKIAADLQEGEQKVLCIVLLVHEVEPVLRIFED